MDAAEVAARCCAGDEGAWAELRALAERELRPRLERLLRRAKIDPACDADDVLQILYLRLSDKHCRWLRAFRGKTEEELICYLRKAALRLVRDGLRAWCRQQRHFGEYKLALCRQPQASDKAFLVTEEHFEAKVLELLAQMPESARRKLRAICSTAAEVLPSPGGDAPAPGETACGGLDPSYPSSRKPPPSPETLRRYRRELYRDYGGLV
ncbi:MAG: hypothetical protein HY000_05745 [Planctomycetes bacterium]|nr:hypothetical protein [Planctomycetota bacterium]